MNETQTKPKSAVAGDRLRSFVERIERLAEEKAAISEDIKEIYAEAKALGFEPKILRIVVARRKMGSEALAEQEALLDVYEHAISFKTTPLSLAASRDPQEDNTPT